MESKKSSQQSQERSFEPGPHNCSDPITDFELQLENWDTDNRNKVSEVIENDEEYIQNQTRIEMLKELIYERILKVLDQRNADILISYMRLVKEQQETTVCMADMIANDLITLKGTKGEGM
ncbi:MAG: hypothetical protein MR646_02245 [Agathobacter sp.]|jgi:hemerythrin-like domain-containing protein|nr:hypothetical protein [Agathobacter sp.]MDY4893538.1 hypothetical protein [Agathobacter sp.]